MVPLVKGVCFVLCLVIASMPLANAYGQEHQGRDAGMRTGGAAGPEAGGAVVYPPMAQPGKKVPIGTDYYLVYGFDKKPKLGTIIMKVEVFTAQGKKDTSFEIKADAGMPSMKGAHETGDRSFVLSNKGDYLLPLNIVMPGGWEVRLSLSKEGKVIFRGSHQFDV